ncbi:MAG TPA: hypothetical protein VFQ01_12600 [Nocardioides sp.]|nr:hypothetical protein [Nocardioides sp.]
MYLARLVARRTRELSEEAGYVDARVAEYAYGRLTWTRFQAGLEGLVGAADSKVTAEAERQAAGQQVARPTRPRDDEFGTGDHGLRGFYIKAPAATVLVFDAALQRIADILKNLGDTAPVPSVGSPRCWSCRGRTWPPSCSPPTRPGPTDPTTPPGLRPRTPTDPRSPRLARARPTGRSPSSTGPSCFRRW